MVFLGHAFETDSELVINPDAVLTLPVCAQPLESISRRHSQIVEPGSCIELLQLANRHPLLPFSS